MTIFQTIILSVIEGVTEFLPISSTGHLILADYFLGIEPTEFVKSFNIAIQLGAILAVVVLYARRVLANKPLIGKLIVAFVPTAVIGLTFYSLVKRFLLGSPVVVLWALALGGILLILIELWLERHPRRGKELKEMTYPQAALLGVAQSLAIIPGVSRSAATIMGGLLARFSRVAIVEFSFLLAIPTMAAATSLDLLKSSGHFSLGEWGTMALGFVISFFVALVAIKWLLRFVRTHNFIPFGIYRIILALLFWLIVL